jgi:hypothetical protein
MAYYDTQQNPQLNPQLWALFNPQNWQGFGYGSGQGAYGQAFGAYGNQPLFGSNPGWSAQPQWGQQQQRQLSQQDVSEVVRQLLPALPQILAQAQQSTIPFGYAAGQTPRLLSQQDVNEVVRQILPFVPQIVGTLQGQPLGQYGLPQFQAAFGSPVWGQPQRQLTQQDVAEITRQLVGVIPQVIGNLQAFNQQRMI